MKKTLLILLLIISLFMSSCVEKPIGGETDEHGCKLMAGYTWCESKQKCLRTWEEECPEGELTLAEAVEIAQNSECIEKGSLTEDYMYNKDTKTWWIDLDMKEEFEKELCNPACVIDEETGTASINWRCTGLTS